MYITQYIYIPVSLTDFPSLSYLFAYPATIGGSWPHLDERYLEGRRRHILEELLGGFSDNATTGPQRWVDFLRPFFLLDTPESIGEDDPKQNAKYVFGSGLKAPYFVETLLILHWWYLHIDVFLKRNPEYCKLCHEFQTCRGCHQ